MAKSKDSLSLALYCLTISMNLVMRNKIPVTNTTVNYVKLILYKFEVFCL